MKYYYHFVVNPEAGSGRGLKVAKKIKAIVKKRRFPHQFYYTEYAGQEQELTTSLLAQVLLPWDDIYRENSEMLYPLLVVIGGDGTLHQVVSSLQESEKNIPLGYIPAGSGNDFARGMRLPKEAEQVFWKIAGTATPQSVTIIKYHDQIQDETGFAINNIGIGLDASIVYAANHSAAKSNLNKFNLGSFAYLSAVVNVLFRQKGFPILVETNGKQLNFTKAFLCTTTNHPYFGGGVAIAPTANLNEDKIDFVLVERVALFKIFWLLALLTRKKQMRSRYFHHLSTNKLRIVSTIPQHGQEDGEEMGKRPFDITITTTKQLIWS
ncbi:diacylglycerol/lipid kinase family protein [Enterococcus gallinarum]|uniref:diacylglycerol/lipid kinase family protein n=1 Tax=Enterococcus gallinarum TaxID=1353 RepID=UPI0012E12E35|nr:diacylglycerol kinase family protein [Enterococcus gallinarum]MUO33243.1 diacylglycerol kinase family lipid kinase [Enterococcus gallinarum]